MSQIRFSINNALKNAIQTKGLENPHNLPLPLGCWSPSNTPILDQHHSPPQIEAQLPHALLHNYATKSSLVTPHSPPKIQFMHFRTNMPQTPQWLQWDAPHPPQTLPMPRGNCESHLPTSSSKPGDPHPKRHQGPISRFYTIQWTDRQTNRRTDGTGDKTCTNTRLYSIYCSDAANNTNYLHHQQHIVPMYTANNKKSLTCATVERLELVSHQHKD